MRIRSFCAALMAVSLTIATSGIAAGQWPTTCVELNDIVEAHLGNDGNVGIYQRVFGDQAEQACQTDHRNDVRAVFAWAIGGDEPATQPDPDPSPPSDGPLTAFEGFGNTDTRLFHLDRGLYRFAWGVAADRRDNFIVRLYEHTGDCSRCGVANEILREGTGSSVVQIRESGSFYLSVDSSGGWVIGVFTAT